MMCTDNFGKMKEMKYNETHQADALASSRSHAAGSRFLRRAAASLLMLFTFGITSSFAEDYVFMTGTNYYFYVNGSNMSLSSSFSPSFLWSGTSGSTFASNGYYLGCTRSGKNPYTYTPTINTSVPSFGQNITIDGSNRLTFGAREKSNKTTISTYYYKISNNYISASTENANAIPLKTSW